jgi:endonuclease I
MNDLYKLSIYGKYTPENSCHYNMEHIVPQSLNKRVNCDLHLLFMSHSMLNRIRSNYAFRELRHCGSKYDITYIYENVDKKDRVIYNQQRDGKVAPYCGFDKYRQLFFPPEESKGIIARSLLYYQERYQNERILSKVIYPPLLDQWNRMYPISEAEYIRHQQIMDIQKRINPFIYYYD